MPKKIDNFVNDSYLHCTTLIREDYIGTLAYLLLDVENPPPQLLLDDHVAYEAEIKSASGLAAFYSIKYVGVPLSHWKLAERSEDGDKITNRAEPVETTYNNFIGVSHVYSLSNYS